MRSQTIPGTAAVEADVAAVKGDTAQILLDVATVDGNVDALVLTSADILKEAFANAHHLHNLSRTVGSTAGVAPGVVTSITPFALTSAAGANNFSAAAVNIFDGTEGDFAYPAAWTPISSYDPDEMLITDVSANGRVWVVRFILGQTKDAAAAYATAADAENAGSYCDIAIKVDQTNADATPVKVLFPRLKRGSKLWAKVKDSTGAGTISFLFTRLHGYPGTL